MIELASTSVSNRTKGGWCRSGCIVGIDVLITLLLHLELGALPRCSMQPRSVEKLEESEDESGKVPGLSALFSACILMDAYSVVSV